MGRIMAIDYGTRRIGLAVTDPLKIIASPLGTIHPAEFDSFMEEYVKKEEVEAFVVGYPVKLNNTPSESVRHINPFIRKLRAKYPGIPLHLADERFTSKIATRSMLEGGMKKKDRRDKSVVDRISASIILQSFLEQNKTENKR